jgi:putative ABC transport system permease protein
MLNQLSRLLSAIYNHILTERLERHNQLINLLTVAYHMLTHSKKKMVGMLIGATFSSFILMQQPGIYKGITDRLVQQIQSIKEADLWVMSQSSSAFDEPTNFTTTDFYRIRSLKGVLWAVQLYRTWYTMKHLNTNQTKTWEMIGVDPETLIGLPQTFIAGSRESIHNANAIIVDGYSLKQLETRAKKTIHLGDTFVEGRNTWVITGITKPIRTYMYQPKAYMASNHLPNLIHRPSFILVKVKSSYSVEQVAKEIQQLTDYDALTLEQFSDRTRAFFRTKTPIVISFVCVSILGFVIGLIVMWQIFSNFILTHLHQFGMLKMLGVTNSLLIKMVLFQTALVGVIGYFAGLWLSALFGFIFYDTVVAFHLTWPIALLGLLGSVFIMITASYFGIIKVMRLDSVELCRDLN